jgi:hypothetical protein
LYDRITETGADIVIQSKYHPDSVVNGFPLKRRFLSRSYNLLVKLLFNPPVSDTQVGIKIYRKHVVDAIMPKLSVDRYASDVEQLLLADKLGYTFAECPVHIDFKPSGDRMKLRDIARIGMDTVSIYYRLNISGYYDDISTDIPTKKKLIPGINLKTMLP